MALVLYRVDRIENDEASDAVASNSASVPVSFMLVVRYSECCCECMIFGARMVLSEV